MKYTTPPDDEKKKKGKPKKTEPIPKKKEEPSDSHRQRRLTKLKQDPEVMRWLQNGFHVAHVHRRQREENASPLLVMLLIENERWLKLFVTGSTFYVLRGSMQSPAVSLYVKGTREEIH